MRPHLRPSYFNPRTPCGVRLHSFSSYSFTVSISIHAPRVGCDHCVCDGRHDHHKFQSTHPVWGATSRSCPLPPPLSNFNPRTPCGVRPSHSPLSFPHRLISIHAPRVGCDSIHDTILGIFRDFNPRTPCGVRLRLGCVDRLHPLISIHAPRVGCDPISTKSSMAALHFNPRTPCGVRRSWRSRPSQSWTISIHAPRVGCDFSRSEDGARPA